MWTVVVYADGGRWYKQLVVDADGGGLWWWGPCVSLNCET